MSCTACAKVSAWTRVEGAGGVLPAGVQGWEQEREITPGFRPLGGPGAAMEWGVLLQNRKGGQFLQSACCDAHGDASWGRGSSLGLLLPSLPPTFRCIPRTDGGSEARCQQGSEQPFPGAPTSPAPPHCASARPAPSFLRSLPGQAAGRGGRSRALTPLLVGLVAFSQVTLSKCWIVGILERPGWGLRPQECSPPRLLFPQVAHTVHLSALGLPGYHLHAAYAGDWQLSPTEVRAPRAGPPLRAACRRRKRVCGEGTSSSSGFLLNGKRGGTL